ncbi:MAG TPA: DASS family sodium-coupled anion symporter [Candidatus Krumholzibacteria bacterium]|nr:DASS family sodium-coupled anion symporter [Candidatus Krumholzibacteria bacterium]
MMPRSGINGRQLAAMVVGPSVFALMLLFFDPVPDKPAVARTLAVAAWLALYWLTEAVPLAATALLPVVLFPLLGVMDAQTTAGAYVNDLIFLFIGGFLFAIAMQEWGLHRRVALRIMAAIGKGPSTLLLGVMGATWMISWWVNNTSTTLMMLPIVLALSLKLEEQSPDVARTLTPAMLLGVAYAASIGGLATLIGTAPNIIFSRVYSVAFPDAPPVTFLAWMAVAVPISTVLGALTFAYLRARFLRGCAIDVDRELVRSEQRALGRISFEERTVFVVFLVFVALIVSRADVVVGNTTLHGWASRIGVDKLVGDGAVAVGAALVLFVIPSRSQAGFVLEAPAIVKVPWDIVILFGGGFALAEAFQSSGASQYLGEQLAGLAGAPLLVILLAVCASVCFLSELASNTALAQVVLPVLGSMASVTHVHPLLLMVPAAMAASCGFMLPVATPPNAIVFATRRVRARDMIRAGFVVDLFGILVIALAMFVWGRWVLGIR